MQSTRHEAAAQRSGAPVYPRCTDRTRLAFFLLITSLSLLSASSGISAAISGAGSGLLAYYPLDQATGTAASDSSGNSYSGTLNGPAWTGGRVGSGALSFDNVNDRVSLPLDVAGAEGAAITVSAWVKPSTIADNGVIVAKDRSGFTQWSLKMDGRAANDRKNNLTFTVNAGGKVVTASSDAEVMADLGWHHVVGVYDGARVSVYMDGVSVDSTPNLLTGTIANYAHQVCIGTSGATCNEAAFFGGLVDDVRLYSRGLAPAEIWDLFTYNGGITPPAPDTVPPAVTITAPAQAATVSGAVTIAAQASDNIGVAGVQFTLDGANLSGEDTTAPYGITWDTAAVANGTHRLRASARDAAGNVAVTPDVTVTVQNVSDTTPPAVSGLAAATTSNGATISWSTNEPADAQVESGPTAAYGSQSALNGSLTLSHTQALSGLSPSTLYHYRVRSRDGAGNLALSADSTFTTSAVQVTGALVHYTFDQASGTSATDSSGNNYTGNLVNGPVWSAGRIGTGALLFDNVNDRVVLPLDLAGAEGGAITVSAWVKPSTIADAGVIVAKDRSGFTQWTLKMDGRSGNNAKNNLIFTVGAGGRVVTATSDAEVMADLGWHHVAGVYNGAQVYVYLDGVSVDATANPLTGTIANYAHQICVGTSGTTCNESAFFGGLIDDVRIYSRGLTATEIGALMSAPPPGGTLPEVTVTATDPDASEAGGTGAFTFSRTGDTAASLSVTYAVGGTATNGTDYALLSGTVTIPAGAATAVVALAPINDTIVEPAETVTASVSAGQSYRAGAASSATIVIADDDVSDTSVIVVDHTSVDLFDDIPAAYMAEVKKMFLNVIGESDSRAYKNGLLYLAQQNPAYAASIRDGVAPEGPRSDALRFSNSHWGDVDSAGGWASWYGEEDWFTSDMAKARTKAHIQYVSSIGSPISAFGFGWCLDMCRSSDGTSGVDPVYQVRWAGSSVGGPQGNLPWGLDEGDFAVTGNSVSLDTYLAANEEYRYLRHRQRLGHTGLPHDRSHAKRVRRRAPVGMGGLPDVVEARAHPPVHVEPPGRRPVRFRRHHVLQRQRPADDQELHQHDRRSRDLQRVPPG